MKHYFILTLIFFCCSLNLLSQIDSTDLDDSTYFRVDLGYLSDYTCYGRVDSIRLPFIIPKLEFHHKFGLTLSVAPGYSMAAGQKRFEFVFIDANYDFEIGDSILDGSIFINKSFYNQSSSAVSSSIGFYGGFDLSHDFSLFELGIENTALISNKLDVIITPYITREIDILNDHLTFNPTVLCNMANSLNFYQDYNSNKVKTKKGLKQATVVYTTTVDKNEMTLMDMEFNMPITYSIGRVQAYVNPTFAIPFSPISTTTKTDTYGPAGRLISSTNENSTEYQEMHLKPLFYFQAGLNYTF